MLEYKKMGLMSGIEIHRRLDTRKLFCHCSSDMKEQPMPYEIKRTLNIAQSETGAVDAAVLHEKLRDKEFVYKAYPNETCLICIDEEPPGPVNSDAFSASLEISLLLNCEIPDEIHTMRKIVIDGSSTSGFQRTALVGINGSLKTSFGAVGITNVSLEEESAQILEEKDGVKVYGLNRLGIPLVEIGTSPDMRTPQQVREVAEKIGSLLKSTGKVKRGLGTIRQDVNVSIKGGARVEIKGAQDLRTIDLLVEREAERQYNLLKIKEELEQKEIDSAFDDTDVFSLMNVSSLFKESSSPVVKGKAVFGIRIPFFNNWLKRKISGERTLGNEVANYAKIKAGIRGFIHSDEDLSKRTLEKEFVQLRQLLGAKESDLVLAVATDELTAVKTADVIKERIEQLFVGIPEETRRALPDGTTEYMRPLPGAARMYPETDIPPIGVSQEHLKEIAAHLPESLETKKERFIREYKLNEELARQIIGSEHVSLFEEVAEKRGSDIAKEFVTKSLGFDTFLAKENLTANEEKKEQLLKEWFLIYRRTSRFFDYAKERLKHPEEDPNKIAEKLTVSVDVTKVEQFAGSYVEKHRDVLESKPENSRVNILMGPIMAEFRGTLTGQTAAEIAKKKLKEKGL